MLESEAHIMVDHARSAVTGPFVMLVQTAPVEGRSMYSVWCYLLVAWKSLNFWGLLNYEMAQWP
jgi:hypothetical protein